MRVIVKIFVIFFILQTTLLSKQNVFDGYDRDFTKAKAFYNKKDYKKALESFLKLYEIAPDSPEINFYLGRHRALELKNYDLAMAAFDRVLIINPTHTRTKLEIARIYYEIGR